MQQKFELRFNKKDISFWASRYDYKGDNIICNVLAPKIQKQKYLTKDDFMLLCRWKSPRPTKQYEKNDDYFIKEVTSIALSTTDPKLSIEILTLLNGVSWPVASVMLHFGKINEYPIIDYRALWSLNIDKPSFYNFELWNDYSNYCKRLSAECNVSMRDLDRALWQYSKEKQK